MAKYIDADLLRKEIEFAKSIYDNPQRVVVGVADAFRQDGRAAMCDDILKKIASLQQEEPVPNDLVEAANGYEKKHTYQRYDGGGLTPEYDATLAEAVIFGAKWQAEHTPFPEDTVLFNKGVEEGKRLMMEEAVECELYYDGDFLAIDLNMEELGYSERDKVRIIIVKED